MDRLSEAVGAIDHSRFVEFGRDFLNRDKHQHHNIPGVLPLAHSDDCEDGGLRVGQPSRDEVLESGFVQQAVDQPDRGIADEIPQ